MLACPTQPWCEGPTHFLYVWTFFLFPALSLVLPQPPSSAAQLADFLRRCREFDRPMLAFASFGLHGRGRRLRAALMAQCMLLDPTLCSVHAPRMGTSHVPQGIEGSQLRFASRFSLHPPGDTASRSGVWTSLLAGCVPVLFTDCPDNVFWGGAYKPFLGSGVKGAFGARSWAVLLNASEAVANASYTIASLRAVTERQLEHMRATGRRLAARNVYMRRVRNRSSLSYFFVNFFNTIFILTRPCIFRRRTGSRMRWTCWWSRGGGSARFRRR